MADSNGTTLADMAVAKELQKAMTDSKEKADKDAKAAAAILKASQLDAAMKEKSKVEAMEAAEALREYHLYMQHAEFMNQITSEYHMPCYPDWTPPAGYAAEPAFIKPRLIMTIRLTDYFVRITDQGNIAELKDQWTTFSKWLLQLGFTVRLDHSAKQIGASCGIVAARVVTWLRGSGDSFMDHDTHMATIWNHIPQANAALANDENCKTPAFKHDPMHLFCTDTLLTGEVVVVTNLFNGKRASELTHVDVQRTEPDEPGARRRPRGGQGASRFCRFLAFDQLLNLIAQDVRASIDGAPVGKKYFVANNQNSNRLGFHWVAVVYEIKASSETPLFVPLQLEQGHHINTQINFDADADLNSSSFLSSFPVVAAASYSSSSSSSSALFSSSL